MNFNFQLRTYKKRNETQAIRLRFFTSANDVQYIDTKISVIKNQWDSKKQLVKKHALEENYNSKLTELLNSVKKNAPALVNFRPFPNLPDVNVG